MSKFKTKNNELYVEEVAVSELANHFPTPFYVYSQQQLIDNYQAYKTALADVPHTVCFAVKSNSNQAILKVLAQQGSGADVVSIGELKRALYAGIPAQKIVFSGVGKQRSEIEYALIQGIYQFNVESKAELLVINEVAKANEMTARIALRINPDITAKTHAKITTGAAENKFGIAFDQALATFKMASKLSHVHIQGVHVHIGSQINELSAYKAAYQRISLLHQELLEVGINLEVIDLGGGLGVCYREGVDKAADLQEYQTIIKDTLGHLDCHFIVEPGRSLTANIGILVSRVIYEKLACTRNFLILDAAMNDFARPSLYEAFHKIEALNQTDRSELAYDIVGPVCESGDTFAVKRVLNKLHASELVAIHDCGAYGATMASTYNSRPLVGEVLVNGAAFSAVKKRQTVEDLIAMDTVPYWLKP